MYPFVIKNNQYWKKSGKTKQKHKDFTKHKIFLSTHLIITGKDVYLIIRPCNRYINNTKDRYTYGFSNTQYI